MVFKGRERGGCGVGKTQAVAGREGYEGRTCMLHSDWMARKLPLWAHRLHNSFSPHGESSWPLPSRKSTAGQRSVQWALQRTPMWRSTISKDTVFQKNEKELKLHNKYTYSCIDFLSTQLSQLNIQIWTAILVRSKVYMTPRSIQHITTCQK